VREAVGRRSPVGRESAYSYCYWSAYVAIGYFLIDVRPNYSGPFFMIGFVVGMVFAFAFGRRMGRASGEIDRPKDRHAALHWGVGIPGSIIAAYGLAWAIPVLRGPAGGPVMVVLFGMVYFMWGVYVDKFFLVLGPIMMLGGIFIGLVPHYPWTLLGAIIALGLVSAGILATRAETRRLAADQA
jgi:hypothetical protein